MRHHTVFDRALATILLLVFLACDNEIKVEYHPVKYPLSLMQEFSGQLAIDAHEDADLSELVDLQGFGPLTPDLMKFDDWEKRINLPEPERPPGNGSVWSWKEDGFARQVVGHFNQESGRWYYLLRLKLYTMSPEEVVFLPEVRRQLPKKRFSSISAYCSDGNSVTLSRDSDGIYLYWHNGIFLNGN